MGFRFRTAQDYMKMARREAAKYAESAHLRQADDRKQSKSEATKKHRLAVAAAKSKSSDENSESTEEEHHESFR